MRACMLFIIIIIIGYNDCDMAECHHSNIIIVMFCHVTVAAAAVSGILCIKNATN